MQVFSNSLRLPVDLSPGKLQIATQLFNVMTLGEEDLRKLRDKELNKDGMIECERECEVK